MNGPDMDSIYETCSQSNKPLVIHAGREPKSEQYLCDPYELCRADKLEAVIKAYPSLKICVPHLGMDEFESYRHLIEKYDKLWLDTSVASANFFPSIQEIPWTSMRLDRIMYGSDYPNLPYAWDREIKQIVAAELTEENRIKLLKENAMNFFDIAEMDLNQDALASNNRATPQSTKVVNR
jgi:predicted TIM-barrel fold metal-dependent hydrolase